MRAVLRAAPRNSHRKGLSETSRARSRRPAVFTRLLTAGRSVLSKRLPPQPFAFRHAHPDVRRAHLRHLHRRDRRRRRASPAAPSKPPPANKLGFAVVANPFASPIVATTVVRKEPSKKLGPAEAPAIPPFSLQAAGPVLTPLVAAPIKVAGADTTTQAK